MSSVSYSLNQDHTTRTIMKSIAVVALALMCVIGMCAAQYGYGYGYPAASRGAGNGGFLALIGLLFLLLVLFGTNTSSSTGGTVTIVNGSASG